MGWTNLLFKFKNIYFFFYKEDVGDFHESLRLAKGLQVRPKSAFIFTTYKQLDFANV